MLSAPHESIALFIHADSSLVHADSSLVHADSSLVHADSSLMANYYI